MSEGEGLIGKKPITKGTHDVRRVRRDLPAAIALSDLLLAQTLLVRVENEKRRVAEQNRGVGRMRVRPRNSFLDAGSPASGGDRAIRVGCDNACLICGRRVRPSEVYARVLNSCLS